ncbi:MAG: DUF4124 domain-containing protein, partial [Halopseudomonas sp.]
YRRPMANAVIMTANWRYLGKRLNGNNGEARMKRAVSYGLFLLLGLALSASATDVYKWIDENGVPSYGERPPEGVEYIKMKTYSSSSGNRTGSFYTTKPAAKRPSANSNGQSAADKSVTKK